MNRRELTMPDFAVAIEGVTKEGQGRWVLAVDGDRLLVAYEDKSLHWHQLTECNFASMADPTGVQPVIVVQPKPGPALAGRLLRWGRRGRAWTNAPKGHA